MTIAMAVAAFLCGACMFSYWLGRFARTDLRRVGDGNPGAFNLWTAAGCKLGAAGVALDVLKGYAPVAWFLHTGTAEGYAIVLVGIAPIAGHAFSPFLRFRGGKAIAVTFGVWSALTRFEVSLVYAVVLAALLLVYRAVRTGPGGDSEAHGLQVVLGLLLVGGYLAIRQFPWPYLTLWFGNVAIMAYMNKEKLAVYVDRIGKKERGQSEKG